MYAEYHCTFMAKNHDKSTIGGTLAIQDHSAEIELMSQHQDVKEMGQRFNILT